MVDATPAPILAALEAVELERVRRLSDTSLDARVSAVKAYQHARLARTYSDLLSDPRYAQAARFFLEQLYGPRDFADRDAQFARVVPALLRIFPARVVATVEQLAELHALSERFDSAMARNIASTRIDPAAYCRAWTLTGDARGRERQIALTFAIGTALDGFTHNAMIRHTLRAMRLPARAAGLEALQTFLETGFAAFREMRGAATFLDTIRQRESALADALFRSSIGERLAHALVAENALAALPPMPGG